MKGGIIIAHIKHKLEILVDIDQPVAEINNVISAFLRLHPGRKKEILQELQRDITAALESMKGSDSNATDAK